MPALTHSDIGKLICAHTGQRISLRTDEIQQHFDFAHALLAQLEAAQAPSEICFGPQVPLVEYMQPKLEWEGESELAKGAPVDERAKPARQIVAGLQGIAKHVRAVPQYRHLLGDMDIVDEAISALQQPGQAVPDGFFMLPKLPTPGIKDAVMRVLLESSDLYERDGQIVVETIVAEHVLCAIFKAAGAVPGEAG